jgi:hypothetical protein
VSNVSIITNDDRLLQLLNPQNDKRGPEVVALASQWEGLAHREISLREEINRMEITLRQQREMLSRVLGGKEAIEVAILSFEDKVQPSYPPNMKMVGPSTQEQSDA